MFRVSPLPLVKSCCVFSNCLAASYVVSVSDMYGLLLDGIYYYLRTVFGEDMVREIRAKANINHSTFSTHQV